MISRRVCVIVMVMALFFLVAVAIIMSSSSQEPEAFEEPSDFKNTNVELKSSCAGGRGAFATKDIKKGEVVEACPIIIEKRSNVPYHSTIDNYVFSTKNKDELAVAFGYCSMFNHRNDPSVTWKMDEDNKKLVLTALKDIKKGEELFVSYGNNYWETRGVQPTTCAKSI